MPVKSDAPPPVQAEVLPASPLCPLLAAPDGAWMAATASTDHRCHAVLPPAALSLPKQRRLCLTAEHGTCSTFLAARDVRARTRGMHADSSPTWGWVRTTPVVDTTVGARAAAAAFLADRRGWQIVPAVALVAALGALGISNIGTDRGQGGPSPSPSFLAAASPTTNESAPATPGATSEAVTPAPSAASVASPAVSPAPSPTAAAVATSQPTLRPSASSTYRVKSGDTLYVIARQFGVTLTALKDFNGLTSNVIHVGQLLLIP